MANAAIATPNTLLDPGFLYTAPLGTALLANTVTGSVFTDLWSSVPAWVPMGMTEAGSTVSTGLTVSEVDAAEVLDPLAWRTTGRTASVTFALKDFTATKLALALNGATKTVTGTAGTTLTIVDPPVLGSEVRIMVGWESNDNTVRFYGYQTINSGSIDVALQKAPSTGNIPFTLNLEKPASTQPFKWAFAGVARG